MNLDELRLYLLMQRTVGIALGCQDLKDHDQLCHDPLMVVPAGKLEAHRAGCAPLAGQSTLNRQTQTLPAYRHEVRENRRDRRSNNKSSATGV